MLDSSLYSSCVYKQWDSRFSNSWKPQQFAVGKLGRDSFVFFCFFWRENTDNFPQFKLTNSLQLNSSRTLNLFRFKKILISFFARYVYTNKFNIAILHQVREDPDRWRMTFSWFLAKKKRIFYYNNDWCEFFCAVIESRLNSSNLHEPTDWLVCLNLCTKNNTRNVIIISFVIQPAQSTREPLLFVLMQRIMALFWVGFDEHADITQWHRH